MRKLISYLFAKYRACAWISCFASSRSDVLGGLDRWKWMAKHRASGRLIEPDVQIQGCLNNLSDRLILGNRVALDRGVTIWIGDDRAGKLELSDRVYVGPYAYLGTNGYEMKVGEDSMIGSHSYIITVNHRTDRKDIPYSQQGYEGGNVMIGKNVWIGCHVTILPGVLIGDGAIIGAGAVVTKNVPSGETWGGVPAKRIKQRRGE